MEDKKLFSQREVNKIFGHIPSKTLRWWGINELYGSAEFVLDGRGTHHKYNLDNLYQIGIVAELSGLNVPTKIIKMIMVKHFRWGFGLRDVTFFGQQNLDGKKWPEVKVSEQMNKMLVISRSHMGFLDDANPPESDMGYLDADVNKKRPLLYGWRSFLSERTEIKIGESQGKHQDATMIIIDLEVTKKFVDSLLSKS